MYLKKTVKLAGLGRFRSASIKGGEYAQVTLIYGGNGRGKTTFCSALRSLKQDSPELVLERRSFGSTTTPEVEFLLDSGIARFSATGWVNGAAAMHIFDGQFIAENVHDGRTVETEQRRNLYRVAVGETGVTLTKQLDDIDANISRLTAEIGHARALIQQHVPKDYTLEQFLSLSVESGLDDKLRSARAALLAATDATTLTNAPGLSLIPIPQSPSEVVALCARTLGDLQADAVREVHAHLAKHEFGGEGETWIADGLQGRRGTSCPFCGADVTPSTVVAAYELYFGEAYTALKAEIDLALTETAEALSEAAGLRCVAAVTELRERCDYWKAYLELEPPIGAPGLAEAIGELREVCLVLLVGKSHSPLDRILPPSGWQAANDKWNEMARGLAAANCWISKTNDRIIELKASVTEASKSAAEQAVKRLEAMKVRGNPDVGRLVSELSVLEQAKKTLQRDKDDAKAKMDAHDDAVFGQFERAINSFLRQFGANFRLKGSTKNYVGKIPQSEYGIEFDKHVVRVGGRGQLPGPGFQTALSAGDKNTLALAFFLAQVERDPKISTKLVVFDDPFTSLDDFRREVTAKAIVRVSDCAAQVVVLSHDKHFLNAVRERVHGKGCTTIQISLSKTGANIEGWDIEREVKEGYLTDHLTLLEFEAGGTVDARTAVTLMRPLLEKYIRYRFPNSIPDGLWLGDMLAIIRSDPSHPLQARYQDLDDINEYTAPFHHDPNTPINEDAVRSHALRTLEIVGGS